MEPLADGTLISVKDCLYFYLSSMSIELLDQSASSVPVGNVSKATGFCQSGNASQDAASLTVDFNFPGNHSYSALQVKLVVELPDPVTGYWKVVNATGELTSASAVDKFALVTDEITSMDQFSFSCSRLELVKVATKDSRGSPLQLVLLNAQLQAFGGDVFADSFDCSPWFTLTMWMSFLLLLLFSFIIALGICFIVNVQTNDRFDDPRGKPLYIPSSD